MIYKNNKLILEVQLDVLEIAGEISNRIHKNIGAIYKGSQLVWLTIYNAIKSCFGSETWLSDYNWLSDDTWKTK